MREREILSKSNVKDKKKNYSSNSIANAIKSYDYCANLCDLFSDKTLRANMASRHKKWLAEEVWKHQYLYESSIQNYKSSQMNANYNMLVHTMPHTLAK